VTLNDPLNGSANRNRSKPWAGDSPPNEVQAGLVAAAAQDGAGMDLA
jgi:hypothetical protein